jgi:DNA-binding IclR family transcriptional regulator
MARPALAASRAIEIVNFLAAHPTEAFTLSDIVERLGINVASSHAILAVLTENGYLTRHPRHRTYTLGPALVAAGTAALEQHPAIDIAREECRRLSQRLELEIAITAPAADEIVFVARTGRHHPRGTPTHVGQRMPMRPPIGSVFLAWSGEAEIQTWLERATGSTTDDERAAYRRILAAVRRRGFAVALEVDVRRDLGRALEALADQPQRADARGAVDHLIADLAHEGYQLETIDPDATYDVSSINAPVFGPASQVVLSLNVVGFKAGLSGREVLALGDAALGAGLVVSKRTRGKVPAELVAPRSHDAR